MAQAIFQNGVALHPSLTCQSLTSVSLKIPKLDLASFPPYHARLSISVPMHLPTNDGAAAACASVGTHDGR